MVAAGHCQAGVLQCRDTVWTMVTSGDTAVWTMVTSGDTDQARGEDHQLEQCQIMGSDHSNLCHQCHASLSNNHLR